VEVRLELEVCVLVFMMLFFLFFGLRDGKCAN